MGYDVLKAAAVDMHRGILVSSCPHPLCPGIPGFGAHDSNPLLLQPCFITVPLLATCRFLDTASISDAAAKAHDGLCPASQSETHPMTGHKFELRVVVYRDGDMLRAYPSIAKVRRGATCWDHAIQATGHRAHGGLAWPD
jgi:hypothetical protein